MRKMKGVERALTIVLLVCIGAFSYIQDSAAQQSGGVKKKWYVYWVNQRNFSNIAAVTDYDYQPQGEYALVWSRIYDPVTDTVTTTQELYDAISNTVGTACLTQTNSRKAILKQWKEEHPLDHMKPVQDMASREYMLLNCLKSTGTTMKSLDEMRITFKETDKALRIK